MCRKPAKKSKLNKVLEKCCGNTNLCTFRISDAYFVSKNLNLVFLSQVKSVIFPMCLAVLNNVGVFVFVFGSVFVFEEVPSLLE